MVLTAPQTTVFFENAGQMGLSNRTRVQLQLEGINMIPDLAEWDSEQWDDFNSNCRRPDMIPNPANPAQLIHQQPFLVPVRSLKRLKAASKMVKYYLATDRSLSAANMQWSTVVA